MRLGKITIAAVGKLKKDHWRSAQIDYVKRLRQYTELTLVEVRDYLGKGTTDEVAVAKEGEALLAATKSANYRIALSSEGQQIHSIDFAAQVLHWIENYSDIAFLIGGPVGLAPDLLHVVQFELSLSSLTFPHELARIILLEQLYRSGTILNNHPYHK